MNNSYREILKQFYQRARGKPLTESQKKKILNPYNERYPAKINLEEVSEAVEKVFSVNKYSISKVIEDISK